MTMTIKRLIATSLLASSLALTSVPGHALESQAPVSQAEITFKDMLGKEWYFADVMTLVKQGIIGGYPDGTFGPAKTITFAEFLAISLKSVTKDIQGSPTGSHWAMGIYMTAIDKGIITGDEFGKSRDDLNAPISREDMALILIRLNELIQEESKQETSWTTVGDQIGVLNVGVYVKLLPKQVLNGAPFNMPGSLSLYGTGVKKSSIKAGQELEGVITVTLLRTGYGEWKTFYGSFSPLGELDPLTDVLNGVAPSKKSPNRLEKLKYSWTRDPDQYYTRYDRNAKAGFSLQ